MECEQNALEVGKGCVEKKRIGSGEKRAKGRE